MLHGATFLAILVLIAAAYVRKHLDRKITPHEESQRLAAKTTQSLPCVGERGLIFNKIQLMRDFSVSYRYLNGAERRVVESCIAAGLVGGEGFAVDERY
jgi:hypothetical protein